MGAKPKTVSLSDATFLIAKKIEEQYHSGFSGWLRAMIRQWDEQHDPVKTELWYKALHKAVQNHPEMMVIFEDASTIRQQASLGDFE
jgi:hypothetical protein|tara:strand:- start:687 stop:947 length:261 start_codon:yes stop_codon:yes gene_type:complete